MRDKGACSIRHFVYLSVEGIRCVSEASLVRSVHLAARRMATLSSAGSMNRNPCIERSDGRCPMQRAFECGGQVGCSSQVSREVVRGRPVSLEDGSAAQRRPQLRGKQPVPPHRACQTSFTHPVTGISVGGPRHPSASVTFLLRKGFKVLAESEHRHARDSGSLGGLRPGPLAA